MYKFFVQTSITHNMVTVDLKMQDTSEAKRIFFYSGKSFQAAAIEDNAKWSNPPYGGCRVLNGEKDFEKRTWVEGRYLPIPENAPDYALRSKFTEPIEQRRTADNVDHGNGIGVDYGCGPVKIQTKQYEYAVLGDVIDKSKEAIISVSLSNMNAVRFVSDIGSDYPVGDERDRRRFISQRTRGKNVCFISILELYAKKRMIKKVEYAGVNKVAVKLADGRKQIIEALNLENGKNVSVKLSEYINGECVKTEESK